MLRAERANDPQEVFRLAMEGYASGLWTAMPGIIQSFDAAEMTCSVQPTIQGKRRLPDNSTQLVTLPLLLNCPVCFPSGGGYTLTFPIAAGDECLVVFAARCIDAWWQSGQISPPLEARMHDLSDGFVIPGPRSQPRVIAGISGNSTQLRSDDGGTFIDLTTGTVKVQGDLHVTGAIIAGYGGSDQVNVQTHRHGGIQSGGSQTQAPVAGS